jgi:uncharacterized protein (DUF1684 family)
MMRIMDSRSIDFVRQWEQWHHDHETLRASAYGFLSITGLHWLTARPERFDDAPGAWLVVGDGVEVFLSNGEELLTGDRRINDHFRFDGVDEDGQRATSGEMMVEVARRDGRFMIRPRDPNNDVRARYVGTPTYPPSIEWLASGNLEPYQQPRPINVGASVEGLTHVYMSPGEISFEVSDVALRLIAFNGDRPDELFVVFSDLTAGAETYGACRFLTVATSADNSLTLDFNRATNPPCAYSDFATCPLPPEGNDLPIRVEAGEMSPLPSGRSSHHAD